MMVFHLKNLQDYHNFELTFYVFFEFVLLFDCFFAKVCLKFEPTCQHYIYRLLVLFLYFFPKTHCTYLSQIIKHYHYDCFHKPLLSIFIYIPGVYGTLNMEIFALH